MAAATAGYVLVGGRSSRFGGDKALAPWRGRPLAVWVAEQVRAASGSVTLVGSPEKYAGLGLATVADTAPGLGPLGGVATALDHSRSPWNLLVACDLPHLRPEFLEWLLRQAASGAADIVMPVDRQGRDEPLCAAYSLQCRAPIAAALRSGVRKVTDAFAGLRVRRVEFSEYRAFDPEGVLFANLNTPADLEAAVTHG